MLDDEPPLRPWRWHSVTLWILFGLFCLRVTAQLAASVAPIPLLPPFDAWHSGVLPYPLLFLAQLVIAALYAVVAWRIHTGRAQPSRRLARFLLAFGALYFASMSARMLLGLTVLRDSRWFHAPIPTFFHLVLASFVLVWGHYHSTERIKLVLP